MHKLIIVDDEPIVRLALKSLVAWEEEGFLVPMEASNGKQALKLIEENSDIDVIITDINMPIMDGLQFIEELKELKKKYPVIVLSAYDDYKLVRQAFKLGAIDYILKAEMNPDDVLKILKKVIGEQKTIPDQKEKIKKDLSYLKEAYLKNLIDNTSGENIPNLPEELQIRLTPRNLAVCFLWIDDFKEVAKRYSENTLNSFVASTINAIHQVLQEGSSGEILAISPEEYVVILSFEEVSYAAIENNIRETLGKVRHALKSYINIEVTVGVSEIRSGLESVKSMYQSAEKNARFRFILGKRKDIFPRDVHFKKDNKEYRIIGNEKNFVAALKEADGEGIRKELQQFIDILREGEYANIKNIYSGYMEIIFIMIQFLNDIGESITNVFENDIDFYEEIRKFETVGELNFWIQNITETVARYLITKKKVLTNRTIRKAIKYIKQNFSNSEINLKMVCDEVELSENYFSALFTKEVGVTFTEYLTSVRIEKAKELITKTNLKMYEICESVGYKSTEHFSRVFKKSTGLSPNAYKNA